MIKVEGATLRVVKSPGHAENHISFVIDEEHSIFSGDNVLGYGTTQYSDLYDYMGMLAAFQRYQPIKLFPGHGGYISDGKGLLDRYYVHRQEREDQVYDWLIEVRQDSTMWSAMDIAKKFYTNTTGNRNDAFGRYTMGSNTSGSDNTAIKGSIDTTPNISITPSKINLANRMKAFTLPT